MVQRRKRAYAKWSITVAVESTDGEFHPVTVTVDHKGRWKHGDQSQSPLELIVREFAQIAAHLRVNLIACVKESVVDAFSDEYDATVKE